MFSPSAVRLFRNTPNLMNSQKVWQKSHRDPTLAGVAISFLKVTEETRLPRRTAKAGLLAMTSPGLFTRPANFFPAKIKKPGYLFGNPANRYLSVWSVWSVRSIRSEDHLEKTDFHKPKRASQPGLFGFCR